MSGRVWRWTIVLAVLVTGTACGGDDVDSSSEATPVPTTESVAAGTSSDDASVEAVDPSDALVACDRLEDLALAIQSVAAATTAGEVEGRVAEPLEAFRRAAADSGDGDLSELAVTASERFVVYLSAQGIDAREAGNEFDIALDRSMERCLALGATNDFPQQGRP